MFIYLISIEKILFNFQNKANEILIELGATMKALSASAT